MPDDETPPVDDSLTESELRTIMGEEIDSRLATFAESFGERFSKLDVLEGLDSRIEGILAKHKPVEGKTLDRDGLLSDIGKMVDEKLSGIGGPRVRKPGPLGRILGAS